MRLRKMSSCDLSVDIETYSSVDISKAGAYAYAESPDFEILLIGYRFSDESASTVIDVSGLPVDEAVAYVEAHFQRFFKALTDANYTKHAFNANFERTCLAHYFGPMAPEQWDCTMVKAARLGLPMSLAGVGEALQLSEDEAKLKTGKALIAYFCKPCKATKANGGRTRNTKEHAPEKWQLFKEYNARDVDSEMLIGERLDAYGKCSAFEQSLWCWDQDLNDRGVLLDIPYIEGILEYDAERREELTAEAARLTGLDNPNSVAQIKVWLSTQGVELDGVTKDSVGKALEGKLPIKVRRVLELRQALGKTSTKKYAAMMEAVCKDSRLRGILQFYGANRTGRWAGRIVQTHNLPQNHIDDLDYCRSLVADKDFEAVEMIYGETAFIFSQLVRTAFIASKDSRFVVCDFSAVEARILGWLAGEQWREDVFRNGGDIYCESASRMYGVPVKKHGINGHLRQRGKVAELALGYQGGVGAMKRMDTTGAIPEEEMQGIVDDWRAASPHIVKLWTQMEGAAKKAISEKIPSQRIVRIGRSRRVGFYYEKGCLRIVLPSGRKLCYWDAKVERMPDGREHITYAGVNQETKQWTRSETYGGKLTENVVQAIGRDCLAEAMMRVADMGYKIVMHVHDEMIVDVPNEDTEAYSRIAEAMGVSPVWAPELILRGDGYETYYYKKD